MAQSFIVVPPDSTGKHVDTFETAGAAHRQTIVIGDPTTDARVVAIPATGKLPVQTEQQLDYDTGAGTQSQSLVGIALPASGGPVAGGTATNPIRTDPTGSTTQPVSGPVTDTQLRASAVPVSGPLTDTQIRASALPVSAAALPLPTGAATEATLALALTIADFDTKTGSLTEAAPASDTASSGLNGRLQRIAQKITLLITALGSPFQAGGSIGNSSFGTTNLPTTVDTNSGNKSASTLRVVLATDQPALTNKLLVTPDAVAIPAGTALIGLVSAGLDVSNLYNGATALVPKYAKIAASSSGANTLVAAVNPKKIRVLAYTFIANGTVNVKFQSGAAGTDLTGLKYCVANMGLVAPFNPAGWFETASNTLLNLDLSAAIAVGGELVYVEI